MFSSKKISYWRFMEPILLGILANILINFVFNPNKPDFIFEEFLTAILFALIITEINYLVDKKLEKKYNWTTHLKKRFFFQLVYLTIILIITLNLIGNLYIWIKDGSFYSIQELLTINLIVFIVALIMTLIKWSVYFYKNWKSTESHLIHSKNKLEKLDIEVTKIIQPIELQKRHNLVQVNRQSIIHAKSELGIVWVYYDDTKAVFNNSLTSLLKQLPNGLFFQANRNTIIRKDQIHSITSLPYGKIDIQLKILKLDEITISRLKAAAFRKWYYSSSDSFS